MAAVLRPVRHMGHPLPADPHRRARGRAAGAGLLPYGAGGAPAAAVRAAARPARRAGPPLALDPGLRGHRACRPLAAALPRRAARDQLGGRPAHRLGAADRHRHLPPGRQRRAHRSPPPGRAGPGLRRRRRAERRRAGPQQPAGDGRAAGGRRLLRDRAADHQPPARRPARPGRDRRGAGRHRRGLRGACPHAPARVDVGGDGGGRGRPGPHLHGARLPAVLRPHPRGRVRRARR